ncbi:UNVERIFIED_CONTAM: hypothetical protein H355_009425 [Colinus virginianus]|nr:hypothetical protein H355_009425 [Colinus virginianus]
MAAASSPLRPGELCAEAGAELAVSEVASSALRSLAGLAGQPLLEKLQPLIKEESIGHVEPAGKTEDQSCETNLNIYDTNSQTEEKYANFDLGDLKDAHTNFDPEVVQIKAGKAEIDRRISAFIKRKQAEINENNVREFCNVIDCNQGNWLARL